jgi:predicted PhzF superfamily epimerase YddE/YHI9
MTSEDLGRLYVWARRGGEDVLARFFMLKHGALGEDFGTGSAAANLGGWLVAQEVPLPVSYVIEQGEPINRPARLRLDVDREQRIFVGGRVMELARGTLAL